ncbi:restriction endonuclease subunit S [Chloroflexota bacterium]
MKARNLRYFKIRDICNLVRGTSPTMKTPPGPYPLVVTAEFRRSAPSYQLEGPAVCIPLISSTGHGDAALHRVHYQEGKFALANLLVALVPLDPTLCHAKYLYYLLTAKKNDYFIPLMAGTANVTLKEKDIAGVEIPLPPWDEQQRVVEQIEKLIAQVQEAIRLSQQTMVEANALLDSSLWEAYEKISEQVKGGKRLPAGERLSDTPTLYPYIRLTDMKNHSVDMSDLKYVPEYIWPSISRYVINSSDVYITIAGTIGYTGTIPDELDGANLTENAARLIIRDKTMLLKSYLLYMLRSPQVQDHFRAKQTMAAQPKLALHRIASTGIPLPSFSEQLRIVAELDALQTQVEELNHLQARKLEDLNALLPSIFSHAFKG